MDDDKTVPSTNVNTMNAVQNNVLRETTKTVQ